MSTTLSKLIGRFAVSSCFVSLFAGATAFAAEISVPSEVQFNRDVRPIFSDKCFACHGPDGNARQTELRLDNESGAMADLGGFHAIVPGDLDASVLFHRVTTDDPDEQMPPVDEGTQLTPREIEILRRWIEQGATWQPHWSLSPPRRPAVPEVNEASWTRGEIDHFILAKLEQASLTPSQEADRRTLIRRLSFDLLGLPPNYAEVESFINNPDPNAYAELIERLLDSQHYGERMAMYWLDLVRFADTNGIHGDNHREHAPYRDYVIASLNDNKPFDTFTIEQLAGDLLQDPAIEELVASGYNRLNLTTREGGAQPKEYRTKYAADRVRNVSAVWLGATMGCCECHDHKFDPFTMRDFYSLAAFFADIKEEAVKEQKPELKVPTREQAAASEQLNHEIAAAQAELAASTPQLLEDQRIWEAQQRELLASASESTEESEAVDLPPELQSVLRKPEAERDEVELQQVAAHYREIAPLLAAAREQLKTLEAERKRWEASMARVLISVAVEPAETRILPRGDWLNESGPVVLPEVPSPLGSLGLSERRATRLDLAHWLVDHENPVVARVMVNRLWKLFFGQGLVRSLDDFGSQGSWPTHPELLDWLAVEFIESGWDIKHMVRLMVSSAAYRQSSVADSDVLERDPSNELLARQSRYRLDAEMIRDNALSASGLLSRTMGGPSTKPYQPAGYWAHLNFPKRVYKPDRGENLYRRGVYTYWCRTFLHPSMVAFDAPSREECAVARPRSNTPLQALVLLNDPIYVEAARAFATRIVAEGGSTAADRLQFAYRTVLNRNASQEEQSLLTKLYEQNLADYQQEPQNAHELLSVGQSPLNLPADCDASELAAWTSVARAILNLHETITRS